MIPHNEAAYKELMDRVDRFAKEQDLTPHFITDYEIEFDMQEVEGYIYIFKLVGNLYGPLPDWKVVEGIK